MAHFIGDDNANVFEGTAADDIADGNGGNDILAGGGGSDILNGGDGSDVLFSGARYQGFGYPYSIYYLNNPVLDTGAEADTLNGGAGEDYLFAGFNDTVDGGANEDVLYLSLMGAGSGVTLDFRQATVTNGSGTISGIEGVGWLQGSNYDDDITLSYTGTYSPGAVVYAMGGNDRVVADYRTNAIFGGEGDDMLDGRPSQYLQMLDGGAGNDTIYTNAGLSSTVYGGAGNDTIYAHGTTYGGSGNDLIILGDTYYRGGVYGEEGDDEIRAASVGNQISGGAGADRLIGHDGADTLVSGDFTGFNYTPVDDLGTEKDVLTGGGGDDLLAIGYGDDADGGSGFDSLQLSFGGMGAGVNFSAAQVVGTGPFNLGGGVIQNIERVTRVRGSEFGDTLSLGLPIAGTIDGGGGDDTLYGSNSIDTLLGGAGEDVIYGLDGVDRIEGGVGNDTLNGGQGDDMLLGDAGADWLDGGDDNDTLDGGAGGDLMVGGAGNDIYIVDDIGDQAVEVSGGGVDEIRTSASFTLGANIERLLLTGEAAVNGTGNEEANRIDGNASANTLRGGAGDDLLYGMGGNDVLRGDAGNDSLYGGYGDDTYVVDDAGDLVFEGTWEGNDLLLVAANYVLAAGQAIERVTVSSGDMETLPWNPNPALNFTGNEFAQTIAGNDGANVLDGGGGNDVIEGRGGDDTLLGGAGADLLDGGAGADILRGGADDDTYRVDAGDVVIELANEGYDVVEAGASFTLGANVEELKLGGAGNFDGTGNELRNILRGNDGNNRLAGGAGADDLYGGAGIDTADYAGNFGSVIVNLTTGTGQWNYAEGDRLFNIENVTGTAFADWLTGNGAANVLDGGAGDDTLSGAGGADILRGGAGADLLNGGTGNDTADYSGNFGAVVVNLAAGVGAWNYAEGDSYSGIENVTGTEYDDLLTGDGGANQLAGAGGDDLLHGGAGVDALIGGAGTDTADYSGDFGAVVVNLEAGVGAWNYAEGDSYSGIENVVGTSFNDVLQGDGANNRLTGGGGADTLAGGGGIDTVDYSANYGAVWVDLATGEGFWNDAEGDRFFGIENVQGSAWGDYLVGNGGANALYGGGGNDLLAGGAGADLLDGGAGNDTIDYTGNFGGVAISLRAGQGSWNAAEGDSFVGIENVKGTSFNDILEGDANANILSGGGGEDLFVFGTGFGVDTISDFAGNGAASGDRIQFGAGMFSGFADMMAHATQQGSDVVITLDAGNILQLAGVQLNNLASGDFLF